VTSKRTMANKRLQVYISYMPDDGTSFMIGSYIKRMLLDENDVAGIMLDPEDGRLSYIDFDLKMKVLHQTCSFTRAIHFYRVFYGYLWVQDCTHFVACMSPQYFDQLEKQQGRPFLEMKAAASTLSSQRIICVHPDKTVTPTPQRIQVLTPMELRKAFVTKPHV
jgi:hypothetical protein